MQVANVVSGERCFIALDLVNSYSAPELPGEKIDVDTPGDSDASDTRYFSGKSHEVGLRSSQIIDSIVYSE